MPSLVADKPIVVVGGGLAGLNCAKHLSERQLNVLLLEASDGLGGRVRTDSVDGFLLDRGFQVFQTAYPEAQAALDYSQLELVELEPGAMIRKCGKWIRMSDPIRRPRHIWQTLINPIGKFSDRLSLMRLRRQVRSKTIEDNLSRGEDSSTLDFLSGRHHFSDSFIQGFLKPWLSGIFLETELKTSANYFSFVFKMLAEGTIAYPSSGIQMLPNQLASRLNPGQVRTSAPVNSIVMGVGASSGPVVHLQSGEAMEAAAVVIATDLSGAARLTDGKVKQRPMNSTKCLYFSAPRPPVQEPVLMLNGDGEGPVNHVFVTSNASQRVAPGGRALINVSLVGTHAIGDYDQEAVWENLRSWYGSDVERWKLLRVYDIPDALPEQVPGFFADREPPPLPDGLLCVATMWKRHQSTERSKVVGLRRKPSSDI